jgi:hypothetical protein
VGKKKKKKSRVGGVNSGTSLYLATGLKSQQPCALMGYSASYHFA